MPLCESFAPRQLVRHNSLGGKKKEAGNALALRELGQVSIPFKNGEQLYYHRSWLAKVSGTRQPTKAYVLQWAKRWLPLFNEAAQVNFFVEAPELRCPLYLFVGRKDYQTHFKLAEDYFNALIDDKKQLFWFDDSGHNLILTEPKKFQEIVIPIPMAIGAGRGTGHN